MLNRVIGEIIAIIGVNGLKIIIILMCKGGETQKQKMFISGEFLMDI